MLKKCLFLFLATFAFSIELQGSYRNVEIDCDDDGNPCESSVGVILLGDQLWTLGALKPAEAKSYCYDNDKRNCKKYGALFTYKETKNLCPAPFHLPSENDFNILKNYLEKNGADKFHANLAGSRWFNGEFHDQGKGLFLWGSEPDGSKEAIRFYMSVDGKKNVAKTNKDNALSVRCVASREVLENDTVSREFATRWNIPKPMEHVSVKTKKNNKGDVVIGNQTWMKKNVKFGKCPAGYRNPSVEDFKELLDYSNAETNNNGAFSLCKKGMTFGYGWESGSGTSISWSGVDLFGFGADCNKHSYGAGSQEDVFTVASFKCNEGFFDLFAGKLYVDISDEGDTLVYDDENMDIPYEVVEETRCILAR